MNHLKHIRGISVRASSNATLPSHYGQHADIYFENYKLKPQLLRSDPLFATKKSHNVDVKYLEQSRQDSLRLVSKESKTICKQRSKTKSSVTSLKKKSSMHKKLPSENIVKRVYHYSTCQNVKFNSNGINKQFMTHSNAIINGAKNINRHSSFMASIEKHPRPQSYAEMIADYSESLYKESTVGAQKDSFYFNNTIRKSPFSTFSVPPRVKKIMNVAEYSELSIERPKSDFPPPIKSFNLYNQCNDINAIECYDFQHHNTCTAEAMNKSSNRSYVITNDLKSDDQSYAKLVADCSKSMHNIPIINVSNDDLVPKRNVSIRNSFESVITTTKRTNDMQEISRKMTPTISTMSFEKNIKEKVINLKENDWLKEMENVISDLKNVTDRKAARVNVPKMKEKLKSDNQKAKDTTIRKLNCQSNKIDRMEKRKKILELQKQNYSHSSGKISKWQDLPHFDNATEGLAVKKNSTLASTSGNIDVLKQPQVKLRMVPSEKESVVSINVDQASFGSLDPLNSTSKHLSVVVQSNQKEDTHLMDNQWNAPTLRRTTKNSALQSSAFGPMHISISEDSAPVKQIEFSINGKPVSELKSITARTEKLDVVSSADKIEIRIPFVKNDSNVLNKTKEDELLKGIKPKGQILNVQISANFQDESTKDSSNEKPAKTIRYQYDKDTIPMPQPPISKTPYLSNNFSKVREETLSTNNIQQSECSKRMDIKFDNTERNINKYKTGTSLIKEMNNVKVENFSMKQTNTTGFPEASKNNENESSDTRVPSKMIPWWSSSDSFNKIRKEEHDHRPFISPSNENQYKTISSLNQNFVTESLLSKPKKTSNSKILKNIQLMNNTSINDSSNSSPNSINSYKESKLHYACSFKLKSNQGNPNMPEIIRNALKAEDKQALTARAKKNINKISGIKQMESITLFKSDTMNIKSKRDIGIKEKTFVQEKIKPPNSTQNLLPKTHQEKTNNYSLKQTRSIDDISKNIKSKIEDILDVIKPIKNNEDGITNYGVKKEMSLKQSTPKLNNVAKEIQNSITTIKDFIPNEHNSLNTSRMMQKSELSKKILLEESKQNKPKSLTSIKNTPEEFKKLKNLTSKYNSSKESSDTIIDKLPLQTEKQVQLKPSKNESVNKIGNVNKLSSSQIITSKTKDRVISTNCIVGNAREISQSIKTKKTKVGDMIAKIVTENPKSKDLLPKKCEKNCFKSGLDKGYFLGSAGPSRKLNDSISFKSAGSNTKSRSAIFKVQQNLNDVDVLQNPTSNVMRSNGSWINMDRPEKSILYSAWLQRSENDIKKNEKLF
ncbi:hypothetical protein ALC62_01596 [Cyphomyrmex costatus]|uniref:Uncharacterized protein n=1 Tax=Cyphomyrmex costatus TaxID=456900 RepID=A0A195D4N8_9HYME|nr:hypothetical protein ALC62_01596 [Cyphomyrmex costatus]